MVNNVLVRMYDKGINISLPEYTAVCFLSELHRIGVLN